MRRRLPSSYSNWVRVIKSLMASAVELMATHLTITKQQALINVEDFTAHSSRVTALNAMGHHGAPQVTMMAQGNWRDPSMPTKYLRNCRSIPILYLQRMSVDLQEGWRPGAPIPQQEAAAAPGGSTPDNHIAGTRHVIGTPATSVRSTHAGKHCSMYARDRA